MKPKPKTEIEVLIDQMMKRAPSKDIAVISFLRAMHRASFHLQEKSKIELAFALNDLADTILAPRMAQVNVAKLMRSRLHD
jgi:hypothetical protein